MQIDDILHNVQADTRARFVVHRLEEWFEDTLAVLLADTDTIVADHNTEVFPVRLYPTAEPHVVLRVFVGIRQQITDHLRDGFLVDDCRKVLVWTIHSESFASLLEGRYEALTHAFYQLMDVLRGEVHHKTLLLHLAEVQ